MELDYSIVQTVIQFNLPNIKDSTIIYSTISTAKCSNNSISKKNMIMACLIE